MSKRLAVGFVALAAVLFLMGVYKATADEKKEVTLSGSLVLVEEGGAKSLVLKADNVDYALVKNDESDKVLDKATKEGIKVKVTGVVEEKEGKKLLTASKIELE